MYCHKKENRCNRLLVTETRNNRHNPGVVTIEREDTLGEMGRFSEQIIYIMGM